MFCKKRPEPRIPQKLDNVLLGQLLAAQLLHGPGPRNGGRHLPPRLRFTEPGPLRLAARPRPQGRGASAPRHWFLRGEIRYVSCSDMAPAGHTGKCQHDPPGPPGPFCFLSQWLPENQWELYIRVTETTEQDVDAQYHWQSACGKQPQCLLGASWSKYSSAPLVAITKARWPGVR